MSEVLLCVRSPVSFIIFLQSLSNECIFQDCYKLVNFSLDFWSYSQNNAEMSYLVCSKTIDQLLLFERAKKAELVIDFTFILGGSGNRTIDIRVFSCQYVRLMVDFHGTIVNGQLLESLRGGSDSYPDG